jgi:hypothetical protein
MSPILSGCWAAAAHTDKASANPAIAIDLGNIDVCNMLFSTLLVIMRIRVITR